MRFALVKLVRLSEARVKSAREIGEFTSAGEAPSRWTPRKKALMKIEHVRFVKRESDPIASARVNRP